MKMSYLKMVFGFQNIKVVLVFWFLDLGRLQQVDSDLECEMLIKKWVRKWI